MFVAWRSPSSSSLVVPSTFHRNAPFGPNFERRLSSSVEHVDVALGVRRQVVWLDELAVSHPEAAELADEVPGGRKDLNAVVVAVRDVDLAIRPNCDRTVGAVIVIGPDEVELTRLRSLLAPATDDGPVRRDLADAAIRLGHIRVTVRPNRQSERAIEPERGRVVAGGHLERVRDGRCGTRAGQEPRGRRRAAGDGRCAAIGADLARGVRAEEHPAADDGMASRGIQRRQSPQR